MINLSVRPAYFDAIKTGLKTVEGRLNSSELSNLTPGMMLCFSCDNTNESITCIVQKVTAYTGFKEMLLNEGLEKMLPGITSLEQGITIYESFPGYKENVKKKGALAIRIKLSFGEL